MTASRTFCDVAALRRPTSALMRDAFAVNSFPGRAKLTWCKEPEEKSESSISIALGSEYGLLVTWQRIQSSCLAEARTIAGRSFCGRKIRKGE